MNDQMINLLSHALERSSFTIAGCFLMSNITAVLIVWLKKSKIHVSNEKETCEFHREDDQAMSVFKTFRNRKNDKEEDWRNVS